MAFAVVTIAVSDLEKQDREFLIEWAEKLNISVDELLKRILLAAVKGEHYIEDMP